VTDKDGRLLEEHEKLEKKAKSMDVKKRPGTGTPYLYFVCSANKQYGYERLAFRVQVPGVPSKTFQVSKYGYIGAFNEAKDYLQQHRVKCNDIPHPSRFRDLIVSKIDEFGYRSLLKEFKREHSRNENSAPVGRSLAKGNGKLRRA
jgi:hypothetical protein